MSKKILLITDIFPPDIGGPATFIDSLGHALHAKGHRVTVICTSEQPSYPNDKDRPYRLLRMKRKPHPLRRLQWVVTLGSQLLTHDTVLVNGIEYQTAVVAKALRRPFVLKIVGDTTWEGARNNHQTTLSIDEFQTQPVPEILQVPRHKQMFFVNQARKIIVPSVYMKSLVSQWTNKEIKTILNGSVLDKYKSYTIAPRAPDEELHVAFVGRLTNWKGVETNILALQGLPQVVLHIFGTGPEMDALQQLKDRLGLNNVHFHGHVTGDLLRQRLSRMHALVLTSSYEGLSHTLIEACAMGLPCITSDCGGNPEVVTDGENGYVVPYGDVPALQKALQSLMNENLRLTLAENAKKRALDFDFNTTVEKTVAYLTQDS